MPQPSNPEPGPEERLRKLERQVRRMRWVHLLLLGLLVGSCGKKAQVPLEIVAKEFKVLDDEGNVYASLGIAPWNPEGALMLRDRGNDERRASLSPTRFALNGGPSSVSIEAGEFALLVMHDRKDWTGAKLSMHPGERKSALWLTGGTSSVYRNP
jgi:hypothetical protein